MAILLRKYQLLYLAQPRTASNSVAEALLGIGGLVIGGHHGFGFEELPKYDLNQKDLTIFSAVRNHYDMLTTMWIKIVIWKHRKNIAFKSWIRQICVPTISKNVEYFFSKNHTRSVIQRHGNENYLYRCHAGASNVVIQFENLQSDLDKLLRQAGAPPVQLQRVNATPYKRPYQDHYDEATKSLVTKWFASELQMYRYNFDNGVEWQSRDNKLLGHGRDGDKLTGTLNRPFPGYPKGSFK